MLSSKTFFYLFFALHFYWNKTSNIIYIPAIFKINVRLGAIPKYLYKWFIYHFSRIIKILMNKENLNS